MAQAHVNTRDDPYKCQAVNADCREGPAGAVGIAGESRAGGPGRGSGVT